MTETAPWRPRGERSRESRAAERQSCECAPVRASGEYSAGSGQCTHMQTAHLLLLMSRLNSILPPEQGLDCEGNRHVAGASAPSRSEREPPV